MELIRTGCPPRGGMVVTLKDGAVIFVLAVPTLFFMQEYREGVGKKGSAAQTPPRCWLRSV
jgi:hypothetical protein